MTHPHRRAILAGAGALVAAREPVTVRWPTLRPWLLRLGVLAAALGLWQGLSAAGVIRADEFPSMTQTASALWDQASTATLWIAIGRSCFAIGWQTPTLTRARGSIAATRRRCGEWW